MAKEGSTIAGLMECFGTVVSVSLQHGVPLRVLCDKLSHTRFEPSGWTGSEELGYAKSIMDYLFRWMELRFLSGKQLALFVAQSGSWQECGRRVKPAPASVSQFLHESYEAGDAPLCSTCGVAHGAQWELLQVRQLRRYEWMFMTAERSSFRLLLVLHHQMTLESRVHRVCVRSILF